MKLIKITKTIDIKIRISFFKIIMLLILVNLKLQL